MRLAQHIIFWAVVTVFLTFTFGQANGEYIPSFYFVTLLLPVAMSTSYFFNYYLVPRYLLRRRYAKFALFLSYTLIISLYLEMLVLTAALIVLANYDYANLNPYSTNLFLLTSTLYLIVFINAFVLLSKRYMRKEHLVAQLEAQSAKDQQQQITVRSDRKLVPIDLDKIYFIESLADYVKIHTKTEHIITKEKIGDLTNRLPGHFIRVHRSFLVNKHHVEAFTRESLTVKGAPIKISRTYKTEVLKTLES